jgi:hypothetical protein
MGGTWSTCETCGGFKGVRFIAHGTDGDLERLGLKVKPCSCPRPLPLTPTEERDLEWQRAVIDWLAAVVERQDRIIKLLEQSQHARFLA